jgi:UDP-N-acetylmuramoyl-tripeptide--D-alanyl-D-alanine ligase
MRLSEAARALSAPFQGADVDVRSVATDSRTLEPGALYVALRGQRFDGHRFLDAAARAGAIAALVDAQGAAHRPGSLPIVTVDDTRLALGGLAANWRGRFELPVVALTGSSGKTTVKEMLAAILREAAGSADAVLATRGNLNNDIGVPLMLLELRERHRYAVLEMGMNHTGEISYLTRLARPDVALVTNAGSAHIEYLGSREAIARAKGEIFEGLGERGVAVVNADDAYAPMWRGLAVGKRVIDFSIERAAQVMATYRLRAFDSEVVLKADGAEAIARLDAPGVHNVRNALAAAAAAVALDVPLATIAAGLARYSGVKGRLQKKNASGGALVIDDTYNANPESSRAAIDVLAQSQGRRIFVFGDMGELGADAPRLHAEVGTHAKAAGIDRLIAFGDHAAEAARAFGAGATHHESLDALLDEVRSLLGPGVTVLVKGSRFMRMERVVAALCGTSARGGAH